MTPDTVTHVVVVLVLAVNAVAWVLLVAGVAKLIDPAPLGAAMLAIGFRAPRALLRAFGIVEVAVGAAVRLGGSTSTLIALAVAYAAFATTLVVVSRRSNGASCGCFGSRASAAGWVGVTLDVVSAAIAATAAIAVPGRAGEWSPLLASIPIAALLVVIHTTGAELADGLRRLRRRDGWITPIPIGRA